MTIRQVGPNRWKVVIYAGRDPAGKQRQKSKIVEGGLRKAEKVERQMLAERDARIADTIDRSLTVNGLVDEWLATRDRLDSPTTEYRRRSIVREIRVGLGRIKAVDLTADDVDAFYNRLRDQPAPSGRRRSESTIHHYHRVLTAILNRAERRGKVPNVVTRHATVPQKPKIGTAAGKPPKPEVVRALMGAAPLGFGTGVHLAAATGMRLGEIMALRWSDFDRDELVVHVTRSLAHVPGTVPVEKATKSGQERDVDLDVDTLFELNEHHERMAAAIRERGHTISDATFLFADLERDPSGLTPQKPEWLTRQWRQLCKRAGVRCRFHDLRHFHATQLLGRGIALPAVSDRLGHTLTSTTANVYSHSLKASGKAAATAIRDVLALPGPSS